MKDEGSRTAEFSAAQKALHTLHGDDPKIFVDPFALGLAGPRLKWVVGPWPMAWLFQRLYSWSLPLTAHNLVRSKYVEDRLDELLDAGLEQYVILGAGMDSFALRRKDLAERLAVYEIDHPRTQATKRQRIATMGWTEPDNVTYVPIDFERQTLREAINQTRFDGGKLTLFSWMGVIQYLTEESIVTTLADLAAVAAPGSEIAFNTLDSAAFTTGKDTVVGRRHFQAVEKMGEPWISGFDPPEISRLLAGAGFEVDEIVSHVTCAKLWSDGRNDLPVPWEHMYLVRARVC